ncbi:MAG TPA: SEC-C metal-binding domain-containing protein [Candidatus Acidoferrum sp.]|nr:SEC-C metal-binding domain-containing protein [Candidatus Acidoferrum sp.]
MQFRGELEDRVANGEISEAEAYREALGVDPADPRALRLLALLAEDEGDFATAQELAWRWLRTDPLSHEVFRLIGRLLGRDPAQAERAVAYQALGREKLHFDPEAEEESDAPDALPPTGEPAEVTHELEPHRLLHTMWVASTGEIDRDVVARVLARGADIAPLLLGILNLYGEDLLDDVDDALVFRSLLLLAEFGDPAVTPLLAQLLPLEDETLSQAASRAFQRLAFRKPAEVLDQLNLLIPTAGPFDLAAQVQQISIMPATPGRAEALLAIERRLADLSGQERATVAASLIVASYVTEGVDSPVGARLYGEYGKHLPAEAKRELKEIRSELEDHGPYVAEEDDATIYDLACTGFEAVDEDDNEPFVRSEPKVGRNDPCWCGSGKKYKKCHLAADESR